MSAALRLDDAWNIAMTPFGAPEAHALNEKMKAEAEHIIATKHFARASCGRAAQAAFERGDYREVLIQHELSEDFLIECGKRG
mgnify:CR=1 FL=1